MIAYKFLKSGRVSPFAAHRWPVGTDAWVDAEGELGICAPGIHACRVADLPYWLDRELWIVELAPPIHEHELKIVAPRGRLRERVAAWNEPVQRSFVRDCLSRTVEFAAGDLRDAGLEREASQLRATDDPVELRAAAGLAVAVAAEGGRLARHAGHLAGYVLDALDCLDANAPAGAAYVAAHTADSRRAVDGDGDDDPFTRERERQAAWLTGHLGLGAS
jgi:hypothetical protein